MSINTAVSVGIALVLFGGQMGAQDQTPRFGEAVKVPGHSVIITPREYAVTFTGPFSLPGVSLPRGTYLFTMPASDVIQVLSGDRGETYALLSTIPVRRADRNGPDIMFGESKAGAPRRVIAWFPHGSEMGRELLYGKRLADAAAVDGDVASN